MANLLVGDIHGCFTELQLLLAQADFSPIRDTLWLTGDLVARGPDSLAVMRYVKSLGSTVRMVLGNHDLHLLGIYAGISRDKPRDHLGPLLAAADIDELINWLRQQPLLQLDEQLKLVMVHAGLSPQWDLATAQHCAHEVEAMLRSDSYPLFLDAMYGDLPNQWSEQLQGLSRLRYITNVFTRIRYCYPNGALELLCKEKPGNASSLLKPWFNLPSPITADYAVAFGHWASLEGQGTPAGLYPLDTGCCWGRYLTLLRWEDRQFFSQPSLRRGK